MMPYYADDWLTVYHGDSRSVLAGLPAESVHCVVTSPPYWGLRDYGTASWEGGDDGCDHVGTVMRTAPPGTAKQASNQGASAVSSGDCRCGAIRIDSQLGLEATPEEFVANMVAVFREVRRVLRPDGTVWLNLGDSYAGGATAGSSGALNGKQGSNRGSHGRIGPSPPIPSGLKPKDLVGIPWRVAFALQADGWYLRSDIIWSKPNPMPESVTDRPTKSHEYLFLLAKSPRYYFDADAVRETYSEKTWFYDHVQPTKAAGTAGNNNGTGKSTLGVREANANAGRNIRSVWTIATAPYPGAHFATFPPKLVEPCIKAGSSERGVCPECGAPWARMVERAGGERYATGKSAAKNGAGLATAFSGYTDGSSAPTFTTVGWQPSCCHEGEPVPAVVLDPFAGSGTTGMVAQSLSRRAVLIDLSMDYLGQLMERNRDIPLGLGA